MQPIICAIVFSAIAIVNINYTLQIAFKLFTAIMSEYTMGQCVHFAVRDRVSDRELLDAFSQVGTVEVSKFITRSKGYCVFSSAREAAHSVTDKHLSELAKVSRIEDSEAWADLQVLIDTADDLEPMRDEIDASAGKKPTVSKSEGAIGLPRGSSSNVMSEDTIAAIVRASIKATREEERTRYESGSAGATANPVSTSINSDCRICSFSGTDKDATFELWEAEILGLQQEGYSEGRLKMAIRRSLKGQAANTMIQVDAQSTVFDILDKFRGLYGPITEGNALVLTFCNAKQYAKETVREWGMRLGMLMRNLMKQEHYPKGKREYMLKQNLWDGLHDSYLRDSTRHMLDKDNLGYDDFSLMIRRVEMEINQKQIGRDKKPKVQQQVAESEVADTVISKENFNALLTRISLLENQLCELITYVRPDNHITLHSGGGLEGGPQHLQPGSLPNRQVTICCTRCGRRSHQIDRCVARVHLDGHRLNPQEPTSRVR